MDAISRVKEVYNTNPEAQERLRNKTNLITDLSDFLKNPPADCSLASLESRKEYTHIADAFIPLGADLIYSELGEDVLLWTWANATLQQDSTELKHQITRLTGKDALRLEKSRMEAWNNRKSRSIPLIKAIYNLDEAVQSGAASTLDITDLLTKHSKPGITLSQKRITEYLLMPLAPQEHENEGFDAKWNPINITNSKIFEIYLDTPTGIALMYKGEPQATIGFTHKTPDTITINQIQGVKAFRRDITEKITSQVSSRGLMPLDWESLLVDAVERIAVKQAIPKISIQSAYNNPWTSPDKNKEVSLPFEKAITRYDNLAQRLGYKQLKKDKNWYKTLGANRETPNYTFLAFIKQTFSKFR